MQEILLKEKDWIQSRHTANQNIGASQSLRTVEHELWQKSYIVFQKNIALAGQIALLRQMQQEGLV